MRKIKGKHFKGSALILTVVLTSLLAIIGMMFVMAANMDKLSSSSVSTSKELNFAVDSVVAEISHELVLDVPGEPNAEYYDYPGQNDQWLANLEPDSTNNWKQISDVTGFIRHYWGLTAAQNVPIPQNATSLIGEHDRIAVDNTGHITGLSAQNGQYADADGDGVVDSKWIELETDTTNHIPALTKSGKHIYAAIRIIDNCAMLNANTAYKFNSSPTADINEINGKSLWQINFMALADRPGSSTKHDVNDENAFFKARANNVTSPTLSDLSDYDKYVIWQYCSPLPAQKYTPFDITDELELRYRFLLNNENIDTRLEPWGGQFRNVATNSTPATSLSDWYKSVYTDGTSGVIDPNYSYRHLATTYSFDRIMNPEGPLGFSDGNMVSINYDPNHYSPSSFAQNLYKTINEALTKTSGSTLQSAQQDANIAQLAANIAGYTTNDTAETIGVADFSGTIHYAFQPQPFISEIGIIITGDPCDINNRHYAVELYNPFSVPIPLKDFSLNLTTSNTLSGNNIQLPADTIDPNGYYVIVKDSAIFTIPATAKQTVNGSLVLSHDYTGTPPNNCINENIVLTRKASNGNTICLDRHNTVMAWFLAATPGEYFERDDAGPNILYQHDSNAPPPGSLGKKNAPQNHSLGWKFNLLSFNQNKFVTVGDVSRILTVGPSTDPAKTLGQQLESASGEGAIRVDLRNPDYRNLFQYLTVLDPAHDKLDNDGDGIIDESSLKSPEKTPEVKIPGRININTAPWYVIAQLPWVYDATRTPNYELAKAIVAYRDKQDLSSSGGPNYTSRQSGTGGINNIREAAGFESIGELATVISNSMNYSIDYYAYDSQSGLSTFPDLTPDTSLDDFEERDLIFSRISNLVTVRSDVFTAYILVRLGPDGPQKRVIAILDRSDVYPKDPTTGGGAAGKVKIVALWPVPDAR